MSWNPALEPGCPDAVGIGAIETLIIPRAPDRDSFERGVGLFDLPSDEREKFIRLPG